jgi:hypothetical protein
VLVQIEPLPDIESDPLHEPEGVKIVEVNSGVSGVVSQFEKTAGGMTVRVLRASVKRTR